MSTNRSASVRRRTFLKRTWLVTLLALASPAALASTPDPQGEAKSTMEPTGLAAAASAPLTTQNVVVADNGVRFGAGPIRVVRTGGLGPGLRAPIDARIVNITFINRSRNPPDTYAATTREAIDGWTNTVFYGAASGLGTPVDQWVAMVYWLDR
jgi:hypothetical protein